MLFDWTRQDGMQIFQGILFFKPQTLLKQQITVFAAGWVLLLILIEKKKSHGG